MTTKAKPQQPKGSWRWPLLILACAGEIGGYYAMDIPSALKQPLINDMNLSEVQFNLLYSVDAFPNIILPLFAGILVDKWGTGPALMLFLTIIAAGQFVVSIGVSANNFITVLLGRALFGFGGESVAVAQQTLVSGWFDGKEKAFAMGINLSLARAGTVINDWLSPWIYNEAGLSSAVWFGFILCLASLLCGIAAVIINALVVQSRVPSETTSLLSSAPINDIDNLYATNDNDTSSPASSSPSCGGIFNFSASFWLLSAAIYFFYAAVSPFNNIGSAFLMNHYGISLQQAGQLLAIPFLLTALGGSSLIGLLADKIGHRIWFMIIAAILLIAVHIAFIMTTWSPTLLLLVFGLAYVMFAATSWPCISYVVSQDQLGLAFGMAASIQNICLSLVPLVVGWIKDTTQNDDYVEWLFVACAVIALIVVLILQCVDTSYAGGRLNSTSPDDIIHDTTTSSNESLTVTETGEWL